MRWRESKEGRLLRKEGLDLEARWRRHSKKVCEGENRTNRSLIKRNRERERGEKTV